MKRAIVGNEALLSSDLTIDELATFLARARQALSVAVGTAEPWHLWIQHPELANHVDFIAVHLLPYWEGIHVDDAVDHIVARMDTLKATFPDKPIVIGEVGWPSFGRARGKAVDEQVRPRIGDPSDCYIGEYFRARGRIAPRFRAVAGVQRCHRPSGQSDEEPHREA